MMGRKKNPNPPVRTIGEFAWNDVSNMKRYKAQATCGSKLWLAIRHGLFEDRRGKVLCPDCGKIAIHHDHRDWRKPLEVDLVCHSCNLRRGPAAPFENTYRTPRRGPHPINGFALSMLEATTEPFE